MANREEKNVKNVSGPIYNDYSCIDCGLCPEIASQIFKRDDEEGYSYVYKQPENLEEFDLAKEAINSCPTESIGVDR